MNIAIRKYNLRQLRALPCQSHDAFHLSAMVWLRVGDDQPSNEIGQKTTADSTSQRKHSADKRGQ